MSMFCIQFSYCILIFFGVPAAMNLVQRSYPRIQVKERDNCFNFLAKHLHGDQVPEIFRALGLRDQSIFAELNLYKIDRNYYEAIHRLLLEWVRLKAANATLDVLCPILDNAGLEKLSQNLLQQVEDLNSPVHKSEQPDTIISVADNVIESCYSDNIFEHSNVEQRNESTEHENNYKCAETVFCKTQDGCFIDSMQRLSLASFDRDNEITEKETSM